MSSSLKKRMYGDCPRQIAFNTTRFRISFWDCLHRYICSRLVHMTSDDGHKVHPTGNIATNKKFLADIFRWYSNFIGRDRMPCLVYLQNWSHRFAHNRDFPQRDKTLWIYITGENETDMKRYELSICQKHNRNWVTFCRIWNFDQSIPNLFRRNCERNAKTDFIWVKFFSDICISSSSTITVKLLAT